MKFIFSNDDGKAIFDNPEIKAMFEKLNQNAGGYSGDPIGEQFGDPLASRTDWGQLSNSNLKFRAKKLVTIGARRITIKPTAKTLGLVLLFIIALLAAAFDRITSSPSLESLSRLPTALILIRSGLPALVPVFIAGLVGYAARPFLLTTTFDSGRGRFWNAWEGNRPRLNPTARSGRLADIHAVQLLGGYLPRSNHRTYTPSGRNRSVSGGFHRYELNLVLEDASRLHLFAHGDEDRLREDGERLASFLGKPLWAVTPKQA